MPSDAGHVPAGEPEPPELVVWHELLDQRKELSLLKPDVCVKQSPRRIQRLSIEDAGRLGDVEFASEPPRAACVGRVPRGGEQAATGRASASGTL